MDLPVPVLGILGGHGGVHLDVGDRDVGSTAGWTAVVGARAAGVGSETSTTCSWVTSPVGEEIHSDNRPLQTRHVAGFRHSWPRRPR